MLLDIVKCTMKHLLFFMKALCIISDIPVTVKKHNYD